MDPKHILAFTNLCNVCVHFVMYLKVQQLTNMNKLHASATEPQQPDNHRHSQSSICTAQVVLNASVAHLAATQYVPSELR